jgi:hypothetical protein
MKFARDIGLKCGLGLRNFKSFPGDSNVQSRLGAIHLKPSKGSWLPTSMPDLNIPYCYSFVLLELLGEMLESPNSF